MMVNCPKCGFSQPQDQYCANCGVDIVAFSARQKPVGTRLLSNTAFQLSTLAALVIVGALYVRSNHKLSSARLADDTPIARDADHQESQLATAQAEANAARKQMNETNVASIAPASAEPATNLASPTHAPAEQPTTVGAASSSATAASVAATAVPGPAAGLRAALQPAQNIRVSFIEAQSVFLQQLLADAQQTSSDGLASWGIVTNLDQQLATSSAWHSAAVSGTKPITINKRNLFYSQTSGQTVGLTVQTIPVARDEAGTRVQIDVNRTLHDPSVPTADSYNFRMPDNFMLQKGSSLIIIGVLRSGKVLSDPEAQLYRNLDVLKSMTTEQFRNNTNDIAIVIDAR